MCEIKKVEIIKERREKNLLIVGTKRTAAYNLNEGSFEYKWDLEGYIGAASDSGHFFACVRREHSDIDNDNYILIIFDSVKAEIIFEQTIGVMDKLGPDMFSYIKFSPEDGFLVVTGGRVVIIDIRNADKPERVCNERFDGSNGEISFDDRDDFVAIENTGILRLTDGAPHIWKTFSRIPEDKRKPKPFAQSAIEPGSMKEFTGRILTAILSMQPAGAAAGLAGRLAEIFNGGGEPE